MGRLWWLAMLLSPLGAGAAEVRTLELERQDGRFHIESETYIGAPVDFVFAVLTDYEHFHELSSVFEESRFLEPDTDGTAIVYTLARGCVLFFCTEVERVERLETTPSSEIIATAIPERSNVKYQRAHWRLEPEGSGTRVLYVLEMEPEFWVPPVIGPWIIGRALRQGGQDVAERIENMAPGQGPESDVSTSKVRR